MEESGQKSVTNEITNIETIKNDDKSISAADLCDLKQISCEVGAKDESESCLTNACNEKQNNENENHTNPSNDSHEEQNTENCQNNKSQDDKKSSIECCATTSQEDQQNSKECCATQNNEANSKQCCQIPASSPKLKQCCQSPSKAKESTSSKPKRKSRSTRRRLNAMINNSSLHFSDTDSEGELVIMDTHVRGTSPAKSRQGPVISVTMDDIENADKSETNPQCLIISPTPETNRSRRGSFVENLTDVDEFYSSEPENEQKLQARNSLTVAEFNLQAETDVEDMSNDEDEPVIYVAPRSDILCDFSGETITTKEGDGPFSVEIRNRMFKQIEIEEGAAQNSPDIMIMPNTDSEDMEMSDEEDLQVDSCSQRYMFEDLDVLAASQIVMTNVNKTTDMLGVKDTQEDVSIGDCHTDVEDVDCAE